MELRKRLGYCLLVCLLCSGATIGADKISGRLRQAIATSSPGDRLLVWVFFTDKGGSKLERQQIPRTIVSDLAIQRRLKVLPPDAVVDVSDLPIDEQYVAEITAFGLQIRQRSKWLNAISASGNRTQILALEEVPEVERVDLVARLRRAAPEIEQETMDVDHPSGDWLQRTNSTDSLDYGASARQLQTMNVPPLHALGMHGEGVIVGVFDNGFRLLSHQAFDTLRPRIVAQYDFVDHKTSVVPRNPSLAFGSHGVNTLSSIGGYHAGSLIGPAYAASYILARTENDSSETPIEEDNWVAAIEWAESLGVQVTSTSLGYLGFDAGYTSLTWADMNGRTAIISLAATIAARKGVLVCNSAGNEGENAQHNTLIAPADADSILTVGAVDSLGTKAAFSSVGPTVDGRTKPDVMAQGVAVYVASSSNPSGYGRASGTSFSCPLAAGAAALLVQAFPTATPQRIIHALRSTASQSSSPDNRYGSGIIDAFAALNTLKTTDTGHSILMPESYALSQNYPNPFNLETHFEVQVPIASHVWMGIYDVLGRRVSVIVDRDRAPGVYEETWDGTTSASAVAATGVYFARLEVTTGSGKTMRMMRKVVLLK